DVEAVRDMEAGFSRRSRLVSGEMTSLYRKQRSAFDKEGVMDDRAFSEVLRDAVEDYARQGDAVIVGRGGQMILRDWPNVLHVRLYAAEEIRAQRLMAREGIPEAVALRRVQQSDEQKRQFIRQMFNNADWRSLKYYTLAIDTGRIPIEAAAKIIILAARALG
ncbi:MAG: cytidylate kinase-like family protein, partial [Anaerolineae bacterium]|nr:cytidylate kinase-like family protein [Anaerolineae bacterium]